MGSMLNLKSIIPVDKIVEAAVNTGVDAAFEQLRSGLSSFFGVDDEVKRLERVSSKIRLVLKDAQAPKTWVDELRQLSSEMQQIVDEMNAERLLWEEAATRNQVGTVQVIIRKITEPVQKPWFRRGIKIKIIGVLERLDEIAKEADALGLIKGNGGTIPILYQARLRPETSPCVDESAVRGRETDIDAISELLLISSDSIRKEKKICVPRCQVISIVGRGGIGKTTLAQLIFQYWLDDSYFHLQSWACVSNAFDIAKITTDLLECYTSKNYSNMSLATLQRSLQDEVKDKRCLIVLDDLRTKKDWDRLEAMFSGCSYGSKILVTTRDRNIATDISTVEPYVLGTLGEKYSWELFKNNAFPCTDASIEENLGNIGKEIMDKCEGIPRAIKVIGTKLRGVPEERWESVLKSNFWQSVDEDADDDEFFPALKGMY